MTTTDTSATGGSGPMSTGDVMKVILGAVAAIIAAALLTGGGVLLWAHTTQRDDAGYYSTSTESLSTRTGALTASIDLGELPGNRSWTVPRPLGTVRIEATPRGERPVFVGIAPTSDVDAWLEGVAHAHVTGPNFGALGAGTDTVAGDDDPTPPEDEDFWAASASGRGTVELRWPSEEGRWTAVLMNTDGSTGIAADVSVGARTAVLLPIGIVMAAIGVVFALAATALMFFGLRSHAMGSIPLTRPGRPGTYPARLDGRLDPEVGRWTWLVKWVLVIPHAVVLAFLWMTVTVLTVVAGVAILFTGRYPRAIFEYNLGVMRWSWRVNFYTTSAFATDRFPPFSLQPDASYPADFAVEYPEHPSRGLVLVKWLLAIPHLLIVGVLVGGWGLGPTGAWRVVGGGGLILLLALIAAVVLTVRGRYPESLFDALMGLNRWCYRVLAYVALMTDEYPPFRFDAGGDDPGTLPIGPGGPTTGAGAVDLRERAELGVPA